MIQKSKLAILLAFRLFLATASRNADANNLFPLTEVCQMKFAGATVLRSSLTNPSLVAEQNAPSAAFSLVDHYQLKELLYLTAGIVYPNIFLPFAVHAQTFGFDDFRESLFRLAVGRKLGEHWTLGAAAQYALLQTLLFDEQGHCLSADLGLRFAPSERFAAGLALSNIEAVSFGQGSLAMAAGSWQAQAGIDWGIVDKLHLLTAISSAQYTPFSGNIALEFAFDHTFTLSGGIRTNPWLTTFGATYTNNRFVIDVATSVHPILGLSGGVGLSIYF
ncbi:MAG: hypothetical protein LBT73_00640 [Tannerellaceae bacterium]|nr:hypothetical protein [Tannerellaceae bacterium]